MAKTVRLWAVLAAGALLAGSGCAAGYHAFSDCRPGCDYCTPRPLPYRQYDEPDCHAKAVQGYLPPPSESVPQPAPTPATTTGRIDPTQEVVWIGD